MGSLLFYLKQKIGWVGQAVTKRANPTGVRDLDLIIGIDTQEFRSDA